MPALPLLRPHPPGAVPDLSDAAAGPPDTLPDGDAIAGGLEAMAARLGELQGALGAEGRRAVLIVLQGRDASGKDGTIRRVFGGLNPAWCTVTSFKRPSPAELARDYLWRIHQAVPARGSIGVFNRSHYEDVLAVRVHRLVPEERWRRRFDQINAFERMLVEEGTTILKFFLHISRAEQRKRLEERLRDPAKNWKFDEGDLRERARWDDYTEAYGEAIARCSTASAPWYVVPADRNRARNFLVGQVVTAALEAMAPAYPAADPALLRLLGTFE